MRAVTDPPIVNEPTQDWALPKDHDIYRHAKLARRKQNIDTPWNNE